MAFYRGSTITLTGFPKDKDGNPVIAASANLYLEYVAIDGTRTKLTVPLTTGTTTLTYDWDSSVAQEGPVRWSMKAVGTNKIVQDGNFVLSANEANSTL